MNAITAVARLKSLGVPLVQTQDGAAALSVSRPTASKILERLQQSGHISQVIRGHWAMDPSVDRLLIPEYLSSPAYISLQTALFHHGMISQIPEVVYAVTIGKTRRHETPIGTFSLHHVNPDLFFGFELAGPNSIKLATPEKALVDFLYLSPARSRLFAALPELEIPASFVADLAHQHISRIKFKPRRDLVERKLGEILRAM